MFVPATNRGSTLSAYAFRQCAGGGVAFKQAIQSLSVVFC